MKKIIKKNKWNLLLYTLFLFFICLMFTIEGIKNDINKNNLTVWQNIFIGFIACDITIISIFYGVFVPLLIGNVKKNIPLKYYDVLKKKFFNIKKISLVAFMLIIHILQLIGCIYSFYYEPIIIFFTIITTLYFLWIFLNGYQIYTNFDYAYYFSKQINLLLLMIQKDILKNKISKRKSIKYMKKIEFIIDGFPEKENHFNELGNLKVELGIQLYYFAINIFSKGLFLYERFSFFKKYVYTRNLKYLKDYDIFKDTYEFNQMENVLINKLFDYYSLCDDNELNNIFDNIRITRNIILFGNLSYYGMAFLTKLHVKLSSLKNWKIDITWIIFLSNFIDKNMLLIMINNKEQLKCHNRKTAKKFVIDNIYVNPGLFSYYRNICNDKKALKKDFDSNVFQMMHTYAAMQSLFAIGKFAMENQENILKMLSLNNYENQKFIFNKDITNLTTKLTRLIEYVANNKKMKKDNKMFWISKLKNILNNSKNKITKEDIKNIQLKKYDEISDLLVEEVTKEILNSEDLVNQSALKEWTNRLYNYVLTQIKEKNNGFLLYNVSNYIINFPRPLLQLINNLLRIQLANYALDSEKYKNTIIIIFEMKKNELIKFDDFSEDDLTKFINEKFKLIKDKKQSSYESLAYSYERKWFDLFLLNTEDEIRKEKKEWDNMKK